LAEALHGAYPNPVEENWEIFGFCTCHDEWEEKSLGGYHVELRSQLCERSSSIVSFIKELENIKK